MAEAMEHALFEAERMTLVEALSMYTLEAAYAARAEEPGAGRSRWWPWGDFHGQIWPVSWCKRGEIGSESDGDIYTYIYRYIHIYIDISIYIYVYIYI